MAATYSADAAKGKVVSKTVGLHMVPGLPPRSLFPSHSPPPHFLLLSFSLHSSSFFLLSFYLISLIGVLEFGFQSDAFSN